MKGERQQDGFRSSEERPFKFMYKAGDRAVGMEMSQAGSVASAAAEFITGVEQKDVVEPLNRSYFKRPGEQSAFLVLREGREEREERPTTREGTRSVQAGPCLIRSEEWLLEPELFCLYENWLSSEDELQANRMLQRIYYRLQAATTALLESPDGEWAALTLLHPEELRRSPPSSPRFRTRSSKRFLLRWRRASGKAAIAALTCWSPTPQAEPNSRQSANSSRSWPIRHSATLMRRRAASGR